jgi:hypothetical protein
VASRSLLLATLHLTADARSAWLGLCLDARNGIAGGVAAGAAVGLVELVAADPQAHSDLSVVSFAVAPVVADELGVFDNVHGYLALAAAQPTAARRMRAGGLVCLGAGAGLIRADLRQVRGTDICCRSGGVIVEVRGARPRPVPVLARYHDVLLASARFAGSGLVIGGTDPARHNLTNPLARSLAGGAGLPRLDTSRLRATWLADCAQLMGLATFMHAAGITCSQRLGDIIATLPPGDEASAVALLGGLRASSRQR